jgi:hypothetical protein
VESFRVDGISYRVDRPFEHTDRKGTLAVDTRFGGILIPAGAIVCRDCDFDHVTVELTALLAFADLELPAGTTIVFHHVNPRSAGSKLLLGLLAIVLIIPLLAVLVIRGVRWLSGDRAEHPITACVGADCVIRGKKVGKGEWIRLDNILARDLPRASIY